MSRPGPRPGAGATRYLAGAACISIQPLLLNALGIPVLAYIIRSLGPSAYGQFAVASSLTATFSFLTNLGLRGTFVRSVACEPESAPRAMAEQLGLRGLLGGMAAVAALLTAACLGYSPVILRCTAIAAVGLIFTTLATTAGDLFQALHRLPVLATVNMVAGLMLTTASVVAVWMKTGPVGLSVAYLLGPVTAAVLSLALVQHRYFPVRLRWAPRRFRDLIAGSRYFMAQNIFVLDANAEMLLVPKLVGVSQFGLFSAGTMLVGRLMTIPDGLGTAFYPAMAQSYPRGREVASREAARCLSLTLLVCAPLVVLAYSCAGAIASILFPAQADVCRQIICLTMWALPLAGIDHIMSQALNAAGRDAAQARLSALAGACSLPLTVAFVARLGLIGACWSYVLRFAIRIAFRVPCFLQAFYPVLSRLPLARILACNGVMAALMWAAHPAISALMSGAPLAVGSGRWLPALTALLVEGSLGMLGYGGALIALRVFVVADVARLLRSSRRLAS